MFYDFSTKELKMLSKCCQKMFQLKCDKIFVRAYEGIDHKNKGLNKGRMWLGW